MGGKKVDIGLPISPPEQKSWILVDSGSAPVTWLTVCNNSQRSLLELRETMQKQITVYVTMLHWVALGKDSLNPFSRNHGQRRNVNGKEIPERRTASRLIVFGRGIPSPASENEKLSKIEFGSVSGERDKVAFLSRFIPTKFRRKDLHKNMIKALLKILAV